MFATRCIKACRLIIIVIKYIYDMLILPCDDGWLFVIDIHDPAALVLLLYCRRAGDPPTATRTADDNDIIKIIYDTMIC